MNRFEAAPEAAMLPVEEVVSLHNLVMGGLRQQHSMRGRRVRRRDDPRAYLFCMLDRSDDMPKDNTGSVDTYLSVRLSKQHTRYWSMLISFLEGRNTEAEAKTNFRTLYRMDWTKTEAQGVTWNIETFADTEANALIMDTRLTPDDWVEVHELGSSVHYRSALDPMSSSHIESIRSRVFEVSSAVMVADEREYERRLSRKSVML